MLFTELQNRPVAGVAGRSRDVQNMVHQRRVSSLKRQVTKSEPTALATASRHYPRRCSLLPAMKPIILTSLFSLATTQVAAATPASRSTKRAPAARIGIATMLAPNDQDPCMHGMGCALLPWCASAQRLRDALTRSPTLAAVSVDILLVLGEDAKDKDGAKKQKGKDSARGFFCLMSNATDEVDMRDCPGVRRIYAGAQLRRAAELHEKRVIRSGVMSYNPAYIRRMRRCSSSGS